LKRWLQFCGRGARTCGGVLGSYLLWTVWLALTVLLGVQIYIATANELEIPAFALRRLEQKLADSGLRATFSRTSFDPTGRILIENVQLSLEGFPEPVITARSVYVRLNPWMLAVAQLEPREVRIIGAAAAVPAMLSPTGRPHELITHVDATLEPEDKSLTVRQLSGRVAGAVVSARGTLVLQRRGGRPMEETIEQFVRNRFPAICRQALAIAEHVKRLEQPELQLEFTPSESGAAAMSLTFLARSATLERPIAVQAKAVRAHTRLLLLGENPTSSLAFSAAEILLPADVRVRGVQADVYGRFQQGGFGFEPREVTATAESVAALGVAAEGVSAQVYPRPLPRLDVSVIARIAGAPLAVQAQADITKREARAALEGEVSPTLLTPLGDRLKVNVRRFFDFTQLAVDRGELRLGAGWKFERLDARLRLDGINAYGVPMSDGRAVIELEPTRFYSPDVSARLGENFARGSYEHDLKSHEYRFLLAGRLRPMELSPWFRDWWDNFFRQLEFPAAPPAANVDVRGFWRDGQRTSVFVFADAARTLYNGTELDRARTRIFIRPGFFDVLELSATRHEGVGQGRFTFMTSPYAEDWKLFEFAAESSFDLSLLAALGGKPAAEFLQAFKAGEPPAIQARGRLTGPGSEEGRHHQLRVAARTNGEFRFHDFPLDETSFVVELKDDEVSIDDFEAYLAGGVATGHARLWGPADARRLGFDFALADASLGQVVGTVQEFLARQKGLPPPPAGKIVREKANVKLDFAASAEGRYRDVQSFRGEGNASLSGPEIAEISLLGALSELLKFTQLRFTDAQTNFRIEGPRIAFPEVKFRGPDAAIDAQGSYAIDRRQLDFNAKISPFQESANLIKTVVGAVLSPLTNAFEVKLTGTVDDPKWAVELTPGDILRSLTPGDSGPKPDAAASREANTPPPKG
jgi:hypothetical protein